MQPPVGLDLYVPGTPNPPATNTALNAAATWYAFGFTAQGKTLDSVRIFLDSVTGTLATSEFTCSLQGSNAGQPDGTSIETQTPVGSFGNVVAGWNDFFNWSTALMAGTQYWLVFKNLNGTPASNYPAIRVVACVPFVYSTTSSAFSGWMRRISTDSGSIWGAEDATRGTFRIGYSDGTFAGFPVQGQTVTGTTNGIYGAREIGNYFVAPANAKPNVIGLAVLMSSASGVPTGGLRARLYTAPADPTTTAPTLLKTSAALAPIMSPFNQHMVLPFDSAYQLTPGTAYLAMFGETTNSDASSVRFNVRLLLLDEDSNSRALIPLGAGKTAYYNGTTWAAYTSDQLIPMALLLEPGNEFSA